MVPAKTYSEPAKQESEIEFDEKKVNLEKIGNQGKLSVTDKGQGISQDDLPLIFERFYRGKTPSSFAYRGTKWGPWCYFII